MDLAALMQSSPYHRWLGLELVRASDGEVEVRLPYREEFLGSDAGTNVHGGIIATLADVAGCFAVMSAIGRDAPTADIRLDCLRMVPPNVELRAVARTVKAGRTLGLADVEVRTGDGKLVAVARGTYVTSAPSRETLVGKA